MTKIPLKIAVWKEGDQYVAWCLNNGISSFGDSRKEAMTSLKEVLELFSQRGSHAKFKKSNGNSVIVKMSKKQIPHGTFQSILLQSGLKESDFRK